MLETKIDALIAALNANTAALTGGKAVKTEAKAPKEATAPAPAPAPDPAEGKAITYDDVKAPFLTFVKDKGREAGVELLKKFGAAKLPDVKPEQFADVLAAIAEASKANESALA